MSKQKEIVRLKDQSTSFHDFTTGFDIARTQEKELGDKIGRDTALALQHGRLIRVQVPDADKGEPGKGKEKEK